MFTFTRIWWEHSNKKQTNTDHSSKSLLKKRINCICSIDTQNLWNEWKKALQWIQIASFTHKYRYVNYNALVHFHSFVFPFIEFMHFNEEREREGHHTNQVQKRKVGLASAVFVVIIFVVDVNVAAAFAAIVVATILNVYIIHIKRILIQPQLYVFIIELNLSVNMCVRITSWFVFCRICQMKKKKSQIILNKIIVMGNKWLKWTKKSMVTEWLMEGKEKNRI